jgi:hypothetical protein
LHNDDYLNETFLSKVRDGLLEHGLMIISRACANPMHRFTYTVGLTAHDHPELLIVGVCGEDAQVILNDLGRQVIAGHRFTAGETCDGLLIGGYSLAVIGPVDPDGDERYPIAAARAVFSDAGPPFQVVMPDDQYRFPWHPGYDMDLAQPLLGPAPA